MVNLKNNNVAVKHFVLFLTFLFFFSCGPHRNYVTRIEGKQIGINNSQPETAAIDAFVKPYREHIDEDLSAILAYAPETLEKFTGEWQTNIGNFMSDVTMQRCTPIFKTRENLQIDICLLNHGGIRAGIAKGNVTARTAYEVMPFENSAIVVALKGEQLKEIATYIIKEHKPHPLSGMTFTISKDKTPKDILVGGNPLNTEKTYYVVTSDYLANGGDNMAFFKKFVAKYDLDYKLRNILIDYFKDVDTLEVRHDQRISVE
ncbi:MAG: hypothetical protein CFE23_02895 [Flavobacterium sp. BFFFF1]|uniref:5'-nucleotidase C-terminal domain-containing protein n=1 Tax=Flavobacterium sp. BFFFF1 TaxID=2015557 RepID=UPI000BD34FE5|nr:5'-nucleotidase [Flavobacterium sp. BFFFF1]OYU81840.1 MAG: hypothetical protein CFE23_02895 [Flavobacterium sp. BFFFF1]